MPLIDTVVEVTVRRQKDNHLIVAEKDGTEYMFDPGQSEFIEHETLFIRVTGLDRNLELGRKDQLLGIVVDSQLKLPESFLFPVEVIETEVWDPVRQYGPTAAKDFFPDHYQQKWKRLTFRFSTPISEEDMNFINEASEKLQQGDHDEAIEMISESICKIPWMVDLYHVLGAISESRRQFERARKYFTMGVLICESILPDDTDFVMDSRDPDNAFYLSHLHSLANVLLNMSRKDEALEYYQKCYRLVPQDHGSVRVILQTLTGRKYPLTDKDEQEGPVDPYTHFQKYSDFPIRDSYDPEMKVDYKKWLSWEPSYKRILIYFTHQRWFHENKITEEQLMSHLFLHDMVESAIARNDLPDLRRTLARFLADGVSRHEAIHQIGKMLIEAYKQDEGQPEN